MREGSFTINGVQTAYQQWGNPDGPLILALHGWLDNVASFAPLAPLLPHYNLIAFDFPGHGHSAHFSSDLPYHFIDAVIHTHALIQERQWGKISLLGHSMGGAISTLLASIHPERIEKLIVIEGLGPITDDDETAPMQVINYMRRAQKVAMQKTRVYNSLEECAKMRAQKGFVRLEEARLLTARGAEETHAGWAWRHDTKLYLPSPIHLTEAQVLAFLRRITAPTCFIIGDQGFRYDQAKIDGRVKAVSQIETHWVPGGHHCHMEYPEKVAEVVRGFLTSPQTAPHSP